jgi:vacuolar-type H+-ATPase subunit H
MGLLSMNEDSEHSRPAGASDAIERVLAAEAEANERVAECRRNAIRILEEARDKARRIERREEDRVSWVHAISDQSVDRAIEEIKGRASEFQTEPELDEESRARLDEVAEQLAAELTGAQA